MRPILAILAAAFLISAQQTKIRWTEAEKPILARIAKLRELAADQRWRETRDLALLVRPLPATPGKQELAIDLANLVTEGDPDQTTLQQTANTLLAALEEQSSPSEDPWFTLAQLVRYEGVRMTVRNPRFDRAMRALDADDQRRNHIDFTLRSLDGKAWTLRQLSGKVVLVNFWATWCPPCRKEMPDLDAIYRDNRDRGLAILAISDEEQPRVEAFLRDHPLAYPILLDPGRRVNDAFVVRGIPKTFIYDRSGHLAQESVDMRTRRQFLEMLKKAGL